MTTDNRLDTIQRMRGLADNYLADANSLEESYPPPQSHGSYLLRLTAFEILLKALILANNASPMKHHNYEHHFRELPCALQERVLEAARCRFGPHADFSNPVGLLRTWTHNFSHLRYSYEAYDGMSEKEVQALADSWIADGAKDEQATFVLFPLELDAFVEMLKGELARATS